MLAAALAALLAMLMEKPGSAQTSNAVPLPAPAPASSPASERSVDLNPTQLNAIKIAPVQTRSFPDEREAVGTIDYDSDLSAPVLSSYPGRILKTFAALGDHVEKGQPLYSIDSPDLVQAESALISSAASLDLTTKEFQRAKDLYATNFGVSQREFEQAASDQQTAQGAFNAARRNARIFGKTEAEIDRIIANHRIDSTLVISSPVAGVVTAFSATPGLLVQPSGAAPFTVSDMSVKWMLASVIESEAPLYRFGQPVRATLLAYPGRVFAGTITKVYPGVDPNTHRLTVRCNLPDADDELRPGMMATFLIQVHPPVESPALPDEAIVRNGDGAMTAWVTSDRRHFVEKLVTVGLSRDGERQIVSGLQSGQLAVINGAIFLNNILEAPPAD